MILRILENKDPMPHLQSYPRPKHIEAIKEVRSFLQKYDGAYMHLKEAKDLIVEGGDITSPDCKGLIQLYDKLTDLRINVQLINTTALARKLYGV